MSSQHRSTCLPPLASAFFGGAPPNRPCQSIKRASAIAWRRSYERVSEGLGLFPSNTSPARQQLPLRSDVKVFIGDPPCSLFSIPEWEAQATLEPLRARWLCLPPA